MDNQASSVLDLSEADKVELARQMQSKVLAFVVAGNVRFVKSGHSSAVGIDK